jgi:membrane protein required for colicin V production
LNSEGVRTWAARTIIFVAVLLLGTAIGAIVTQFVRVSLLSSLDRLLGFLFGFLRGTVALGVLVLLCHAVRLNEEHWYQNSTLVPYAEHAGNVLRALVGESRVHALAETA